MAELTSDPFRAARLLLTLRRSGITNPDVLAIMEKIPRDAFVGEEFSDMAFEDCSLPIACGQVIPRLSVIGDVLQRLELGSKADKRVLLIGMGSGYTTALLASLAQEVYAFERFAKLFESASEVLSNLEINNIHRRHGDGLKGWTNRGPFDRILLMGSVRQVPETLLEQLSSGGFLLAPVIRDAGQQLMRHDSVASKGRPLGPSIFTPLAEGAAKAL